MNKAKLIIQSTIITLLMVMNSYAEDISITDAWINEAPPGVSILAAYATINNLSDIDINLIEVHAESFEFVELHESMMEDGMASMKQHKTITIASKSTLSLKPGGFHLMLFNPKQRISAGDQIRLIFRFADQEIITINANVKRSNQAGHDHHHHH